MQNPKLSWTLQSRHDANQTPVLQVNETRETHNSRAESVTQWKWWTDVMSANVTMWEKWETESETEAIEISCHLHRGHSAAESTTIHLTQSLSSSLTRHSSSSYILQLIEEQFYIIVTIYVLSIFIRSRGIWPMNSFHVRPHLKYSTVSQLVSPIIRKTYKLYTNVSSW